MIKWLKQVEPAFSHGLSKSELGNYAFEVLSDAYRFALDFTSYDNHRNLPIFKTTDRPVLRRFLDIYQAAVDHHLAFPNSGDFFEL